MLIDMSIISSSLSLCWRFWSCTCFSFLCLLLCASINYFIAIFLCIGSMSDWNVVGIFFLMLSFVLQLLFLREHPWNFKPIFLAIKKELLGDTPCYLYFQFFLFLLVSLGLCYYCINIIVSLFSSFVPSFSLCW